MRLYPPITDQRRRDLPGWLLVAIAIALLAGAAGTLGAAQMVGGAERIVGSPGMFSHTEPIDSIEDIAGEPAKANLLAREVVLDDVQVARVLGNYSFLVADDGPPVLVVLLGELTRRQAEEVVQIREGQRLRVYGTVRRLRDVTEIEDIAMTTREQAEEMREHAIYVSAEQVVVLEGAAAQAR